MRVVSGWVSGFGRDFPGGNHPEGDPDHDRGRRKRRFAVNAARALACGVEPRDGLSVRDGNDFRLRRHEHAAHRVVGSRDERRGVERRFRASHEFGLRKVFVEFPVLLRGDGGVVGVDRLAHFVDGELFRFAKRLKRRVFAKRPEFELPLCSVGVFEVGERLGVDDRDREAPRRFGDFERCVGERVARERLVHEALPRFGVKEDREAAVAARQVKAVPHEAHAERAGTRSESCAQPSARCAETCHLDHLRVEERKVFTTPLRISRVAPEGENDALFRTVVLHDARGVFKVVALERRVEVVVFPDLEPDDAPGFVLDDGVHLRADADVARVLLEERFAKRFQNPLPAPADGVMDAEGRVPLVLHQLVGKPAALRDEPLDRLSRLFGHGTRQGLVVVAFARAREVRNELLDAVFDARFARDGALDGADVADGNRRVAALDGKLFDDDHTLDAERPATNRGGHAGGARAHDDHVEGFVPVRNAARSGLSVFLCARSGGEAESGAARTGRNDVSKETASSRHVGVLLGV